MSGSRPGENFLLFTRPHSQQNSNNNKKQKKLKKKRISVENLTGYDDIVCEFALSTFKLFDQFVNFSWLFI